MNKCLFTFLSAIAISVSGYSQTVFQQVYGRNTAQGFAGQQTSDGGYIMSGLTTVTTTNYDYLVVKIDANGDTLWTKTYGGIGDDESYAMQQTTDGGYIFAGIDSSSGLGNYNVYLVKTDANGDTLWTKSYGGSSDDFGQAVQQTADGGYIVAGYTGSFGAGNNDVYLLKTDANGNLIWSKTYGGAQGDYAFAVKQTAEGGYIVAGITSSFGVTTNGTYNDIYLLKTNSTGTLTWSKTYGKDGDDWGFGVIQTNDGGYAITGHTQTDSLDNYSELCLIKTDLNGDTLFTKSFGGPNFNKGLAILQTSDSGFAIGGSTYSFGNGASDFYLLKTNKTGSMLFNSTFGGGGDDIPYAIGQTSDNGFVLSGYTQSYAVDSNSFYMVKTDASGNSYNCNQTNPTPSVINGVAIIGTPATVVGSPATITANSTHTKIKSGVTILNTCPTAGIKQVVENNKYQFMIYPNPSNGNITLKTDNLIDNTQLTIYNQLGQVVLKKQLTNELTIINLDINSGVYQVRILSGNELIYQTKIIKE
jgi:type IX secretion system substrate protein